MARILTQASVVVLLGFDPHLSAQSLRATPELRLNGNTHDLSLVSFATAFADGTIIVAQPHDARLLFFAPDGRPLGRYGSDGGGPRQFTTMMRNHGFSGEQFWVGDVNRIHVVSRATLTGEARIAPDPVTTGGERVGTGMVYASGLHPGGDWLVHRQTPLVLPLPDGWRARMRDDAIAYFWVNKESIRPRLVASRPGNEVECGRVPIERTNCLPSVVVAGPNGSPLVVTDWTDRGGGRAVIRVSAIKETGDTSFFKEFPVVLQPVHKATLDSLRRGQARASRSAGRPREYFSPLSGTAFVGRDGAIWIGLRQTSAGRPWLVLHPDGREFGRLTVPGNVWLTAGTFTQAWGVEETDDGVHDVVRFRIHR